MEGSDYMSNHTYIKYLTEQFVTYINKAPHEKNDRKNNKKSQASYTNRWFGLLPFAFKMIFKNSN